MRRLVVLSAFFILAGLVLLLPSVPLWGLLTAGPTGSLGSSTTSRFASAAVGTSTSATTESLVAFGAIGLGLILEVFSLFTDVGSRATPASDIPDGKTAEEKGA